MLSLAGDGCSAGSRGERLALEALADVYFLGECIGLVGTGHAPNLPASALALTCPPACTRPTPA